MPSRGTSIQVYPIAYCGDNKRAGNDFDGNDFELGPGPEHAVEIIALRSPL